MRYIAAEDVAKAKEMDLLTYLRNYEPQELVHVSGNTYCTREHDSLRISNGKWCWFSQGIGGRSALDYVIANKDGQPLTYTQFKRLWTYITTRTVKPRKAKKLVGGKYVKYTIYPVLGEKARNNGKVVYSLDFEVTPHQLRHTYITNLIYASVDPKTVQYLAGHENSKITMDIYAKAKYNRPKDVAPMLEHVFDQWNETTTK